MSKRNERTLTEDVVRTLCYMPDTFAYETDTKATAYEDKKRICKACGQGRWKFIPTISQGKADLAVVRHGFAGAIELKLDGNKLEEHQKDWADSFQRGRGFVGVAHSVGESVEFWKHMNPANAPIIQDIIGILVTEFAEGVGMSEGKQVEVRAALLENIRKKYAVDEWKAGI